MQIKTLAKTETECDVKHKFDAKHTTTISKTVCMNVPPFR